VGAAIDAHSVPRRAFNKARAGDVFAMSQSVHDEITDVLHRPRLARFVKPDLRDEVLALLLSGAEWFRPAIAIADCRDPLDNKYLELALASGAGVIVSSDNHLLVMHPWRGVRILRPAEYIAT
jgi:putative PIN family toxin of toxin-antitoxin system